MAAAALRGGGGQRCRRGCRGNTRAAIFLPPVPLRCVILSRVLPPAPRPVPAVMALTIWVIPVIEPRGASARSTLALPHDAPSARICTSAAGRMWRTAIRAGWGMAEAMEMRGADGGNPATVMRRVGRGKDVSGGSVMGRAAWGECNENKGGGTKGDVGWAARAVRDARELGSENVGEVGSGTMSGSIGTASDAGAWFGRELEIAARTSGARRLPGGVAAECDLLQQRGVIGDGGSCALRAGHGCAVKDPFALPACITGERHTLQFSRSDIGRAWRQGGVVASARRWPHIRGYVGGCAARGQRALRLPQPRGFRRGVVRRHAHE